MSYYVIGLRSNKSEYWYEPYGGFSSTTRTKFERREDVNRAIVNSARLAACFTAHGGSNLRIVKVSPKKAVYTIASKNTFKFDSKEAAQEYLDGFVCKSGRLVVRIV